MNRKQELSGKFFNPLFNSMQAIAIVAFSSSLSAHAMAEDKPAYLPIQSESRQDSADADSGLSALRVSFKFSPQSVDGTARGGLWVSPSTFASFDAGSKAVVEARVDGIDRHGKVLPVQPQWIVADSGLLKVTPTQGQAVKITVQHFGRSTLKVVAQGVSKMLSVKADSVYQNSYIKVAISQQ